MPDVRPNVLFLPCYRDKRMLDGVCKFAYEADWVLDSLYYHTGDLPYAWDGDGILCMLQLTRRDRSLSDFVLGHADVPTVDLSVNDPTLELPRMLQDNAAIGRMGAQHLVSRGCRHLGFVMHTHNSFHDERLKGFQEAANRAGLDAPLIRAPSDYMGRHAKPEWLTRHVPADEGQFGIMAASDYLTQWVIRACNAAGMSVPEDIALVGVDNCSEICELSPVGISSIDNNAFQHGYEGARLLHAMMQGAHPPAEPILVPPGALHVRASTDIMATRHPHVAAALHRIADHFKENDLTPKSVAARIPMSERRLHDAFVKHVGRSIYQEITHRRLQHALKLVQETDRKLWDIAEASGFSSPELMSRLFRNRLGHPPSSYRRSGPYPSAPSRNSPTGICFPEVPDNTPAGPREIPDF